MIERKHKLLQKKKIKIKSSSKKNHSNIMPNTAFQFELNDAIFYNIKTSFKLIGKKIETSQTFKYFNIIFSCSSCRIDWYRRATASRLTYKMVP